MGLENKIEQLQKRVSEFEPEFRTLLGKYNLGLGARASITQDGRIEAQPVFFDASEIEQLKTQKQEDKIVSAE